jgi:hypothetical protein
MHTAPRTIALPARWRWMPHSLRIAPTSPRVAALACLVFPGAALATAFSTSQDLHGVFNSDARWGDIDNDGDLDWSGATR